MIEKPILFSAPMVRALLAGRKTQTRRVVKPRIVPVVDECFRVNGKWCNHTFDYDLIELSPYGKPGDRLWVRETHRFPSEKNPRVRVDYRADMSSWGIADCYNIATNEVTPNAKLFPGRANEYSKQHWKPSIYMPRWASRLTLEITAVRVERLQAISRDDAAAEGVEECPTFQTTGQIEAMIRGQGCAVTVDYIGGYRTLWESISGPGSWAENPWVWVIEFRRVDA